MRPPPRAVRRAVVDPLFLPVAALLGVVLVVVVVVSALAAPFTRRRRLLRLAGLALAYVAVDAWLVLVAAAMWLRRRIGGGLDGDRWTRAHTRLLTRALAALLTVARWSVGFHVALDPAAPSMPDDRPVVLLARHAGPGDSFALAWLVLDHLGRVPRVVLKDALLWDPGLDIVLTRLSGCFLPSGAGDDNADRIAATTAALGPGDALLLFPEGGNWTPARHRRAVRRLWRSGRRRAARQAAASPNLLPPRPAGTAAALAARPDLDVLVVAHTGLDEVTTIGGVWNAVPVDRRPMRVTWWRVPAARVPRGADEVPEWLNRQWTAVARWVRAVRDGEPTTVPTTR